LNRSIGVIDLAYKLLPSVGSMMLPRSDTVIQLAAVFRGKKRGEGLHCPHLYHRLRRHHPHLLQSLAKRRKLDAR